ncbi:hypothetical protein ACQJBY_011876 [Aegilops geniculata]
MAHNSTSPASHVELPETSSRCVTESRTHNLEVAGYSLDGMGVGKYIRSSRFSVGGYDWCIRFYPDGETETVNDAGNASCFLFCVSQKEVRVMFTLNMLEKHGAVRVTNHRALEHTICPPHYNYGLPYFVEKSRLKSSALANNGYVTIRCALTVIKEPPAEPECEENRVVVPPQELPGDLGRALKHGNGTDVVIDVGSRLFSAHKFMLAARSPVFKAQLFGPMMKKGTRRISVVGMEPAIFGMLLEFIYTDLPPTWEGEGYGAAVMQHLLVAADRYGLNRLKLMCEEKLCESIDVETVTTTLALAEQHNCEVLKKACLKFMSSQKVMDAVGETDGFKHLMASCPLLNLKKNLEDKIGVMKKSR